MNSLKYLGKKGLRMLTLLIAVSILSFVICFYALSKALYTVNLSIAYATWSAVGLTVTALISVFLFKEALTPAGVLALVMITIGVVVLNMYGAPVK